jgi:hypothetical protein
LDTTSGDNYVSYRRIVLSGHDIRAPEADDATGEITEYRNFMILCFPVIIDGGELGDRPGWWRLTVSR